MLPTLDLSWFTAAHGCHSINSQFSGLHRIQDNLQSRFPYSNWVYNGHEMHTDGNVVLKNERPLGCVPFSDANILCLKAKAPTKKYPEYE